MTMAEAMKRQGTEPTVGPDAARAMLALLRRQATLYTELAALAKTQHTLIAAEDPQPLLKILGQRQRVTGELQRVAEALRPLRVQWDAVKDSLNPQERQDADALVQQTKAVLGQLLASDEQDAQRLRIRKQRTGEALRAVHANRQAVVAYGGAAATSSGCLDRMHEDV